MHQLSDESHNCVKTEAALVNMQVSEQDIDAAFRKYRGSDEEASDLLRLYSEHDGRMPVVALLQIWHHISLLANPIK